MKTPENSGYLKRTQKDYSLSFKLQLVEEVEQGLLTKSQAKLKYGIQGDSTVTKWLQKYGNFDWENQVPKHMSKTPEQKILELEAKVKLLEKQKARAEHLAEYCLICWLTLQKRNMTLISEKITHPTYRPLQRRAQGNVSFYL